MCSEEGQLQHLLEHFLTANLIVPQYCVSQLHICSAIWTKAKQRRKVTSHKLISRNKCRKHRKKRKRLLSRADIQTKARPMILGYLMNNYVWVTFCSKLLLLALAPATFQNHFSQPCFCNNTQFKSFS